MAYIGRSPEYGNAVSEQITGTNSVGPYALSYDTSTSGVVISLDGVVQRNSVDFNIVGTALTFTSTVGTGIIINVVFTGLTLSFPTPSDGSVTDAKIVDMAASKLTGALPAISGANLTSLPSDITKSTSEPTATTNPSGGVGTVYLRTTTGEMYCCTDATTNDNVWTNIGDGTGLQPYVATVATGGTITTDGDYKVHTFNSSSTFTVTTLGHDTTIEYIVVAGGGAGGSGYQSGGGGAGGYRSSVFGESTGGGGSLETSPVVTASAYTVTVGAGGTYRSQNGGNDGADSSISGTGVSITSAGGGGGGSYHANYSGNNGGSGGGAGDVSGDHLGGSGTANQGFDGGDAPGYSTPYGGGGGGGAGSIGLDGGNTGGGSSTTASNGGSGVNSSITGSSVGYAGGGGGGGGAGGSPGIATHGGANGVTTSQNATAAPSNRGGGGGGSYSSGQLGSNGGSGVVIIRYQFQ
jgi:hypothetical protein